MSYHKSRKKSEWEIMKEMSNKYPDLKAAFEQAELFPYGSDDLFLWVCSVIESLLNNEKYTPRLPKSYREIKAKGKKSFNLYDSISLFKKIFEEITDKDDKLNWKIINDYKMEEIEKTILYYFYHWNTEKSSSFCLNSFQFIALFIKILKEVVLSEYDSYTNRKYKMIKEILYDVLI